MKIIVQDNQNIFDIAIQYYGSVEGLSQLKADNPDIVLDAEIPKGTELIVDETKVVNKAVFEYIKNEKLIIATGAKSGYAGNFWITENGDNVVDENFQYISY